MNRKENSIYKRLIHGKEVFITFSWNNYTPANYRKDFTDYKDYLTKFYEKYPGEFVKLKSSIEHIPEDKTFLKTLKEEIEFDLARHPQHLVEKELVSFDECRTTAEERVSSIITELFDEHEELMPPINKFSVMIIVENVDERDWYFAHFFEKAKKFFHVNYDVMRYQISGYWLLHNVVIPACHLPDDKSHVENVRLELLQQLKEHQDTLEGNLIDEDKLLSELKRQKYITDKDSANLRYIYLTVHGVWTAALSEFHAEYKHKNFITIHPRAIENFRRLLYLSTNQPQSRVRSFYEQYLGYQNIGFCGERAIGKIVTAIAIAAAAEIQVTQKRANIKPYELKIDGKLIEETDAKKRKRLINEAISTNKEVQIGCFDSGLVTQTVNKIRAEKDLTKFVDYVGRCFDVMEISPQNQPFNPRMFGELINKAKGKK